MKPLLDAIRHLYEEDAPKANRFQYGLLSFDLVTVAYIVLTSFLPRSNVVEVLDVMFGLGILADFSAPRNQQPSKPRVASPQHLD